MHSGVIVCLTLPSLVPKVVYDVSEHNPPKAHKLCTTSSLLGINSGLDIIQKLPTNWLPAKKFLGLLA